MTQEEKQLLIKDLCARLPYGVKVKYYNDKCDGTLNAVNFKFETVWITADNGSNDSLDFESIGNGVWWLKPYLRPMNSMTEEEYEELMKIEKDYWGFAPKDFINDWCPNYASLDWINKNHFDYRGLIDKGLALEAPEGMYNTK